MLAEDDPNLGLLLKDCLEGENFKVELCVNGEQAFNRFKQSTFNLCLLDVMMPRMNGFVLAQEIRVLNPRIPIIFITAKSLKEDKLKGYSLNADDYITKPFDEEELIWKIRAIKRRSQENDTLKEDGIIRIGNYLFDFHNQCLTIHQKSKRITEKESEILLYMARHSNSVIKRQDVLTAVWGENDYFLGRSMDVYVAKLRKLLKTEEGVQIETIPQTGYRLWLQQGTKN